MNKKITSLLTAALFLMTAACAESKPNETEASSSAVSTKTAAESGSDIVGGMELQYAEQFSADYRRDGCSVITIGSERFLLVPEGMEPPNDTAGMTVIRQPVGEIYLAASSAMDLFDGIGALDRVTMTSTDLKSWSLPNIRAALENGSITYIGKYNAPDYEALTENGCGLAIESTMIYHSPETREKIEQLGIPVLVERSSYESHPLGRMEWLKLYGLILGKSDEAEKYFREKTAAFDDITEKSGNISGEQRKTAAFFYVSSNGYINIRKPGDYVPKMIELAGGEYVFKAEDLDIDDNALSTMNIQTEKFYELAMNADVLIYNSTIEGELADISQLTEKCGILADFKAVKEGNVWCTGQNMFQQTTGAADMIADLNKVFSGNSDSQLIYLHRLE
ncbi:MAG: ABC transporter substrate-binding protein [Ruminococcus sp.]|nr:ABC transporter substrate-binding protein [Ruminococcus sp.]